MSLAATVWTQVATLYRLPSPAKPVSVSKETLSTEKSADGLPDPVEFGNRWNTWAKKHGMAQVKEPVSEGRQRKIRTRLKEQGWFDKFQAALKKLPAPGPAGSWQPDLDWLIHNSDNIDRVLEGKFDWRKSKDGSANKNQGVVDRAMERFSDETPDATENE